MEGQQSVIVLLFLVLRLVLMQVFPGLLQTCDWTKEFV